MSSITPPPTCPYCGQPAELVMGDAVYPQMPKLHTLCFWVCTPCDARVGCHGVGKKAVVNGRRVVSDGQIPLGSLANAPLRQARQDVHSVFDPLWTRGDMTRSEAYAWLSMRVPFDIDNIAHVAHYTLEQCSLVIDLCLRQRDAPGSVPPRQREASQKPDRQRKGRTSKPSLARASLAQDDASVLGVAAASAVSVKEVFPYRALKRRLKDRRKWLAYITLELATGRKTMPALAKELRTSFHEIYKASADGLHHAGCGPERRAMTPSEIGAGLRAWMSNDEAASLDADSLEGFYAQTMNRHSDGDRNEFIDRLATLDTPSKDKERLIS